jgi:hypothetical protein
MPDPTGPDRKRMREAAGRRLLEATQRASGGMRECHPAHTGKSCHLDAAKHGKIAAIPTARLPYVRVIRRNHRVASPEITWRAIGSECWPVRLKSEAGLHGRNPGKAE